MDIDMKLSMCKKILKMAILIIALVGIAAWVGTYHGYKHGYNEGMQNTNTWWIDKQSRYYDSSEVEKKHLLRNHNLI